MGAGALFLVIEARAQLENGTSSPDPKPKTPVPPYSNKEEAIHLLWPVICFVVLGSTIVHGLSVMAISVGSHFRRKEGERAPLIGGETEPMDGMHHEEGNGESEPEVTDSENESGS